jgi:hypothetical protein
MSSQYRGSLGMSADRTEIPQIKAETENARPNARQRFAKGRRPFFMNDPDVDRLLAIATALTAEVAVVRERLAVDGLPATPANIEAYQPDSRVEAARETIRAAMIDRVFRVLAIGSEEEGLSESYATMVERFS